MFRSIFFLSWLLLFVYCGQPSTERAQAPVPALPVRNADQAFKPVIRVQPFKDLPTAQAEHVIKELKKYCPEVILLPAIALPAAAYYKPRNRYRADTLIAYLSRNTPEGQTTIGITGKDISTDKGEIVDWGVMGLGYQPGKSCVVSTFRLSKTNLLSQLFKVSIHELGHTQGLDHCPEKSCFMRDAEGKNHTDEETGFCVSCKTVLMARGWKL